MPDHHRDSCHQRPAESGTIHRAIVVAGVAVFWYLLDNIYRHHISPTYGYLGYMYFARSLEYTLLSLVGSLLPAMWMPVRQHRVSETVIWLLFLVVYIPSQLFPFVAHPDPETYVPFALVLSICFLGLLALTNSLRTRRVLCTPSPDASIYWGITIGATALLVALMIKSFGFKFSLSLSNIYDSRDTYKSAIAGTSALVSYLFGIVSNAMAPVLLAYSLQKKYYLRAALVVCAMMFLFSVTGYKAVLFSSVLVMGMYAARTQRLVPMGALYVWATNAAVALLYALDITRDSIWYTSIGVRRMFATPGILSGEYYRYFVDQPKLAFSHSFLSSWTDYPLPNIHKNLIAQQIFGSINTFANANMWADGYANLGFWGMVLVTVLLAWILVCLDWLTRPSAYILASCVISVPCFALINSSIFTTILTHRLWATFLAIVLFPVLGGSEQATE